MKSADIADSNQYPRVALLGAIPDDIYPVLAQTFQLLDVKTLALMDESARANISVGLTSAIHGVTQEVMSTLPGIVRIASVGAGMDKFDLPWLEARGVEVVPTADVMTEDVAEFSVGLIFATLRNIVSNDRLVRAGEWLNNGRGDPGRRISGSKIGIVGLGRIGGRIASKLSALGCKIYYTGPTKKDVGWKFIANILDLAETVDVLVMSCIGGESTRGLVNTEVLDRLGPSSFIVNVSRGSVIDENALITALEAHAIAGAALDVFENEPSPDPRFSGLSNCILQPHISVFTKENRVDLARILKQNLRT